MPPAGRLLLHDVELDGRRVDVEVAAGRVHAVGPGLPTAPGTDVVDGRGGALLPGLHDHHVHLLASAAARQSIDLAVGGLAELAHQHRTGPPGAWLRAVGYHEPLHGPLDRYLLDALAPGRQVRVQHQSGAMWVLSSPALAAVGQPDHVDGRLVRCDELLRARVPRQPLDLAGVGTQFAGFGVTGLTDATPTSDAGDLRLLAGAIASGALPQRIVVMTGPGLDVSNGGPDGLELGPVKVVVSEHDLPTVDELAATIVAAHAQGRAVALHLVSRLAVVLALTAWEDAGARAGDRIEHGAILPPELDDAILALGLTLVTQPGFVRERGDRYRAEVEALDQPHLYRCGTAVAAGIEVAGSTDAPYGSPDPWQAMQAAIDRTTASGHPLGTRDRLAAREALALFLGDPFRPGGPIRTVRPGGPADLCLLHQSLDEALGELGAVEVALVVRRGRIIAGAG